jgi:hypothetical protein
LPPWELGLVAGYTGWRRLGLVALGWRHGQGVFCSGVGAPLSASRGASLGDAGSTGAKQHQGPAPVGALRASSEHPAAACAGNQRRRGRGKRSGREGPGREVAGEDLRSAMAVPIKDGAGARTHLALGEEETGLRWLGALGSGRFFRAANFSIFRFAEPLRSPCFQPKSNRTARFWN